MVPGKHGSHCRQQQAQDNTSRHLNASSRDRPTRRVGADEFCPTEVGPPEAAPGDPPHQREDVGTRDGRNEAKQDKEFSALGAKQKGRGKGASRPGHSQDRQIHLPGFLSFTILPGSPLRWQLAP